MRVHFKEPLLLFFLHFEKQISVVIRNNDFDKIDIFFFVTSKFNTIDTNFKFPQNTY